MQDRADSQIDPDSDQVVNVPLTASSEETNRPSFIDQVL
jgi:hypothetical protein